MDSYGIRTWRMPTWSENKNERIGKTHGNIYGHYTFTFTKKNNVYRLNDTTKYPIPFEASIQRIHYMFPCLSYSLPFIAVVFRWKKQLYLNRGLYEIRPIVNIASIILASFCLFPYFSFCVRSSLAVKVRTGVSWEGLGKDVKVCIPQLWSGTREKPTKRKPTEWWYGLGCLVFL